MATSTQSRTTTGLPKALRTGSALMALASEFAHRRLYVVDGSTVVGVFTGRSLIVGGARR
jgi:hypothetical protein